MSWLDCDKNSNKRVDSVDTLIYKVKYAIVFIGLYVISFTSIAIIFFPFYLLLNDIPRSNVEVLSQHLGNIATIICILSIFLSIKLIKIVKEENDATK